jgi:putative mRNA 3-end processing factor
LELRVRQRGGIIVEYGDQGILLDPTKNYHSYPAFVTHAHADHATAFKHPEREKYATRETYELLKAMGWSRLNGLIPVKIGDTISIDDFEIKVHNSGHVLGSVQYEVNTPGGKVLYTGDICTEDTFTTDAAEIANCDILVIETTFGSPMFKFPIRQELAVEICNWAVNTVLNKRIPAFKTDTIGNAQELISIFNQFTNLSVVTAKNITRVTEVYRSRGYNLDSVDANGDEGKELLKSGKCVLVMPKRAKMPLDTMDVALASGWATIIRKKIMAFPLSDHADYRSLLSFTRRCRPKRVLTFHGGSMTKDFHNHVRRTLRIPAAPLSSRIETINGPLMKNETRIKACSKQITQTIRIPGFLYQQAWIVKEMGRQGFTPDETENSIRFLIDKGIFKETEAGIILNTTT